MIAAAFTFVFPVKALATFPAPVLYAAIQQCSLDSILVIDFKYLYLKIAYFFTYKSVIVPVTISLAKAKVSDKVG